MAISKVTALSAYFEAHDEIIKAQERAVTTARTVTAIFFINLPPLLYSIV